ncbi:G protein-coupled receptor, class C, group 5, member Bb isoform X2 [Alosa sapidissima]|uniref:G protein-coupled receptor, class C, group 5, member Bb isoform X2 n=1 Tax=Alosa sapidissima TaxID=34773 RepID=UPI001C09A0D9|nr:G protein-coupled receptor, class C, group 5, member Bb isoform X2 [Alosa sapidissima]
MAISPALLFLLSVISCGSTEDSDSHPQPPRGCGSSVGVPYQVLCDLESVWGVVLEAVACGGAVTALVLALVLLTRLRYVPEPERRSGVGPLLLLLAGTVGLFGLSFAFLVGRGEGLCVLRRALWGPLFALCFSCLLAQALRLRRLAAGKRGPTGGSLAGLAVALTLVQGVIAAEWLLLTVLREGHAACDYLPVDFTLACSYALGLLLMATGLSLGVVLCGGGRSETLRRRWRCNGVWLFLSCLASLILWAAWLGFYLYNDLVATSVLHHGRPDWDEPALAVALVTEGWALLLFHAIPEAHLCLRQEPQFSMASPEFYDTTNQSSSQLQDQGFEEDEVPPTQRPPFADNQAFTIEEHSAALRSGAYHNGLAGARQGLPFRSHVYQPTEMALLMNSGTIPTAPPNFTGRQLW